MVKRNWQVDFCGDPFLMFHAKLKKVKTALTGWSKREFSNIFIQRATLEDIVRVKEEQLELDPTPKNREELSKVEAELRRNLKLEEEYWKQKSGLA